jgi:hypothetical protein
MTDLADEGLAHIRNTLAACSTCSIVFGWEDGDSLSITGLMSQGVERAIPTNL